MDERGQQWGRKEREIELRVRIVEERMDNREHNEHNNFPTKENDFISLKKHLFLSYNRPF